MEQATREGNSCQPGGDGTCQERCNTDGNNRSLVPAWRNELRVTHEISARHNDAPEGKFTYICRAAEASSGRWKEHISAIYSVKESKFIPDKYASLLVCLAFAGDSHGADTWYKLDPTGKITTLRLHPYDFDADKARFAVMTIQF